MTDVIDGLVNHEGKIRVLQGVVGGKDGVVGLHYSCGNLGGQKMENARLDFFP